MFNTLTLPRISLGFSPVTRLTAGLAGRDGRLGLHPTTGARMPKPRRIEGQNGAESRVSLDAARPELQLTTEAADPIAGGSKRGRALGQRLCRGWTGGRDQVGVMETQAQSVERHIVRVTLDRLQDPTLVGLFAPLRGARGRGIQARIQPQ
jgi:hypothetical protein